MCHDEHIDSGTTGTDVLVGRCGRDDLRWWHDGKGERIAPIVGQGCH